MYRKLSTKGEDDRAAVEQMGNAVIIETNIAFSCGRWHAMLSRRSMATG
jgi:hypothetical protein